MLLVAWCLGVGGDGFGAVVNEEMVEIDAVDELDCGVADSEAVLRRDLVEPHDGVEVEGKVDVAECVAE